MAAQVDEFTLESVKDFMVSRGGRVTNHELVKRFKAFLTNPAGKEGARNQFKQYVNTLANISQEGGEKYLVLKRKYRVGTHLEETVYPGNSPVTPTGHLPGSPVHLSSSGSSPAHLSSSGQFNVYGSPQHPTPPFSPGSMSIPPPPLPTRATPPYRAPPPYRPPPPAAPALHGYPPPEEVMYGERRYDPPPQPHFNGRQPGSSDPRYPGDLHMHPPGDPRYPAPPETRYGYPYEDPADLGIPPPPQVMRSAGSVSSLPGSVSSYVAPHYGTPPPPMTPLSASRPKSLSIQQTSVSSLSEDGDSLSLSAATTVSSTSTPSSDEPPPPVPPRRRLADNKENLRPSPEGAEVSKKVVGEGDDMTDSGGDDNNGGAGAGGDQRKISVSVKETTQKFNRMASESQILSCSSRASSKSNRSSRSDRDDDDTSSIHSFGPEGQEWLVASAKSDFSEILRLLKIHPTLARHKDIANGYTAMHWAAKHGRTEVVKLLAGTHHAEVNARSNGGYTPLHISAMYSRTDVFDLLVHYGADLNMRDYSGKKPRSYSTIASTVSMDTQKSKFIFVGILASDTNDTEEEEEHPARARSHSDYGFQRHGSLIRSRSYGLPGIDRAKRAGSKRFERIKKSFTFNAHDKARSPKLPRSRPVSDEILYEEEDQDSSEWVSEA